MPTHPDFQPIDPSVVPRFADIATFMRTRRHEVSDAVDIGLVGVPFDIGVNYRSGARQGPAGVREASRVIRRVHPSSLIKPFEICNVADLGDAPVNPMSKERSIEMIEAFFADLRCHGIVPIAIGGDHTIPLPILRALAGDRPVGVLHFDAHADTLDELCGDRINHATFLRRGHEEGLVDPSRVIQIGMRGSRFDEHDIRYGYDAGFSIVTMDEYEEMGRAAVIEKIHAVLGEGPMYISLDIDGLDPAFLPGTGVPEIGGIVPRDAQVILRSLRGREVVGARHQRGVSVLRPDRHHLPHRGQPDVRDALRHRRRHRVAALNGVDDIAGYNRRGGRGPVDGLGRGLLRQRHGRELLRHPRMRTARPHALPRPRSSRGQAHHQARRAIFEFIEGWYNPHRRHQGLGQQSPMAFERSDQEAA